MRFELKQGHIDDGFRDGPRDNPVALAISAGLSPTILVVATAGRLALFPRARPQAYSDVLVELPDEVTWRIRRHTITGFMEPFEFELDIPEDFLPDGEGVPDGL